MPLALPAADPQPLSPGLHRTDAFHRHPLLLVEPEPAGQAPPRLVRSWDEAHALHGPARTTDVSPAYVAALVCGDIRADLAPYRRIRRLPRAHLVLLQPDGQLSLGAYDPLAAGTTRLEPELLHAWLRQGLLEHVRRALSDPSAAIGCEHSSGLDSNAVLGALVHGASLPPERLHTWSLEEGGEGVLLQQFRVFHGLLAANCHRGTNPATAAEPGAARARQLQIFGAPPQIGGNLQTVETLSQRGCQLLFSGFGGDQALSHNASNVPSDLVAEGRWRELLTWMGSHRLALRTAAGRALGLACRPWAEARVRGRARGFYRSDILRQALTPAGLSWLGPHLSNPYPWELDGYLRQHQSIRRRVLADWVAVRVEEETRLARAHGLDMVYPLLDEQLIGTLLHQDPALFGERVMRGRLIHRRAFAPYLPPFLRDNPTKDREPEEGLSHWRDLMLVRERQLLAGNLQLAADWHPALARWWDLPQIRSEAEACLNQADQASRKEVYGLSEALQVMASLSDWWKALDS